MDREYNIEELRKKYGVTAPTPSPTTNTQASTTQQYDVEALRSKYGVTPPTTTTQPASPEPTLEPTKQPFRERASNLLGTLFGGQKLGEAIGGSIAGLGALARGDREEARTIAQNQPSPLEVGGDVLATLAGVAGFKGAGTAGRLVPRIAKQAGLGAAIGAGRAAEQKQDIASGAGVGGAIGGAFPLAGGIAKGASKFTGGITKGIAGLTSGKGTEVIDTVMRNPQAARQGLRNAPINTIERGASQVRQGVAQRTKDARTAYAEALEELPKRLGRTPKVKRAGQKTTIKADGKTYTLSTQGVKSKLTRELRKFGVEVDPKKQEFDFLESPFVDSDEKILKKAFQTVRNWRNTTPAGLNQLAIKLGKFRKANTPELNSVIDSMKRNVREYIGDRVPAVKELNQQFANEMDIVEAFGANFGTKGSLVGGRKEAIKTGDRLTKIFSGEKTQQRKLLEEGLAEGRDIIAREAGRQLNEGVSRSASSIGDSLRGAIQAVISPKMIGEIAASTGVGLLKARRFANIWNQLSPALRTEMLRGILEE